VRLISLAAAGVCAVVVAGLMVAWLWSWRWLGVARDQLQTRQYRAAEKTLTAFLSWHPDNSEAHYLLGGVYGEQRFWDLALQQFQQVRDDSPQRSQSLWRIGDVCMMLNRAADMEQSLRAAIDREPTSLEPYRGLIALYRWQDRELDAEPLVWKALELTSIEERPFLMAEWFRFHFAQRPNPDIFRKLNAFLTAQPDDLHSAVALGLWSVRQHQLPQARAVLETVFAKFPNDLDARSAWGMYLLEAGDWERLQSVLADWPEAQRDLRYSKLLGVSQQEFSAEYAKSLESLQRWLDHYPDDWQTQFRMSSCLRQLGRTADAEREAARTEELKGIVKYEVVDELLTVPLKNLHRPEHRHRLGEFYLSVGLVREARVWFELALALDSQFQPSLTAMSEMGN
jgi:tetratricopeptide (TPR) repeat protein